jgi:predicted ATPase
MLEKLSSRLRALTGGRWPAARQQTLRAAIDWSYDLLDDQEKAVRPLERLSGRAIDRR